MNAETEHRIFLEEQRIHEMYQQGRYNEAIPLAIQTREFIQSEVGRDNIEFRMILECLAELYEKTDQKQRAVELRREILALDDGHRDLLGGLIWSSEDSSS